MAVSVQSKMKANMSGDLFPRPSNSSHYYWPLGFFHMTSSGTESEEYEDAIR